MSGIAHISRLLAAAVALAAAVSGCARPEQGIRVGVPDDTGGLVAGVLGASGMTGLRITAGFDVFPFKDCCSSTSVWALGSERVDLAFLCPDAARALVEKDSRYEIVGPALLNSDVFVVRPGSTPRRIAYSQGRTHQRLAILERFGGGVEPVPMLAAAVPFAYEKRAVDGAVVDIVKGRRLTGERLAAGITGDVVTYVLVTKKEFRSAPAYRNFMAAYGRVAREFDDPARLVPAVRSAKAPDFSAGDAAVWIRLGVRFVEPETRSAELESRP